MFNLRLCNAATIQYSLLKFGHMHLCGKDYKYFSPHCLKCNSFGCIAAIRCVYACHGPHSDSVYSDSEHRQFKSPRLVKREAGFPNPRRALIGSNQLWRVNDSPYYREYIMTDWDGRYLNQQPTQVPLQIFLAYMPVIHWSGDVVVLTGFSSLAALEVVKKTTFSAAGGGGLVWVAAFPLQCQWIWTMIMFYPAPTDGRYTNGLRCLILLIYRMCLISMYTSIF